MSKISDMKASLKELELLGLPISSAQKKALADAEDEYIDEELVPHIKDAIRGLFTDIGIRTKIVIDFDGNDLDVHLQGKENNKNKNLKKGKSNHGSGKYIRTGITLKLQIIYPNGQQKTGKGTQVLKEFINEVGPQRVHDLGLQVRGILLVEDHLVDGLKQYQKPINDGFYLMVNTNNQQKKKEIEEISKSLNLGIKVNIVDETGAIQY